MPDPRWTGPPELIAAIFEAGSPASVLANNVVWVTETANKELSTGLSAVNTVATAAQWQGVGAAASMVAATGLNAGLQTLVGWTAEKISVTQAAVEAFMLARSVGHPVGGLADQPGRVDCIERHQLLRPEHPGDRRAGYRVLRRALAAQFRRGLDVFRRAERVDRGIGGSSAHRSDGCLTGRAGRGGRSGGPGCGADRHEQCVAGVESGRADRGADAPSPAEATGQLGSLMQQPMQMVSGATEPLKEMFQAPMQAMQGVHQPAAKHDAGDGRDVSVDRGAECGGGRRASGGRRRRGVRRVGWHRAAGGFPGAGLTSYTRPTSSFEPETGGRPTSLRAGVLNAAEVRGPTASTGMVRPDADDAGGHVGARQRRRVRKGWVTRARVVVDRDSSAPR